VHNFLAYYFVVRQIGKGKSIVEKAKNKISLFELYKRLVEHINTNSLEKQKFLGSIPLVQWRKLAGGGLCEKICWGPIAP
jgi:hypothetical protein